MNPEVEAIYKQFEKEGPDEVRRKFAAFSYDEAMHRHAQNWMILKDKEGADYFAASSISAATEANALARTANAIASEANSLAVRALAAAKDSNTIAIIAIILSAIAIPVSIVAIFIK